MSELERVLAELDKLQWRATPCHEAERLLREMAADFARYAVKDGGCSEDELDAARAKWRLS